MILIVEKTTTTPHPEKQTTKSKNKTKKQTNNPFPPEKPKALVVYHLCERQIDLHNDFR